MRIIGGSARGKKLTVFSGPEVRPTPDRVREAVFSMLFSRLGPLDGKSVLDLFAGTGAMALEALSRGAARAILVDRGTEAARIIPANLKACRLEDRAEFLHDDIFPALRRLAGAVFDLIFIDPPYSMELVPPSLETISRLRLLAGGGLVCAETKRQEDIPENCGDLVRIERRLYGTTAVHLFARQSPEV